MCVCLTGHTYNCVLILYLIYNDYIQFNFVAIIYIMIMICFVYVATHAVSLRRYGIYSVYIYIYVHVWVHGSSNIQLDRIQFWRFFKETGGKNEDPFTSC